MVVVVGNIVAAAEAEPHANNLLLIGGLVMRRRRWVSKTGWEPKSRGVRRGFPDVGLEFGRCEVPDSSRMRSSKFALKGEKRIFGIGG